MQIVVPPVQEDIQQLTDTVGHDIENILYFMDGSIGIITKDNLTPEQAAVVITKVQGHTIRPCIIRGTLSERPTAKANGRLYFGTDTKMLYRDNGVEWDTVGVTEWEDLLSKPSTFPPESHNIADHDTDATGAQLDELVGGSQTSLHSHTGGSSFQFPVGAIYLEVTGVNPATTFGYGTWVQVAEGQFLVGQKASDSDFDVAEETGGAKTHTHTDHPALTHAGTAVANHDAKDTAVAGVGATQRGPTASTLTLKAHVHSVSAYTHSVTQPSQHSAQGHNSPSHLPPYFVAYVWKRTA